jgi:hypothetical protein
VLVPAASVSVVTANIRDRRPWARGAYGVISRTTNAAAGLDYSTTSTALVDIDTTNLTIRMECSGAPMRLKLLGGINSPTPVNALVAFTMDGALLESDASGHVCAVNSATGRAHNLTFEKVVTPAAGSHVFRPQWAAISAGTIGLIARSNFTVSFVVEELVRPNANNN